MTLSAAQPAIFTGSRRESLGNPSAFSTDGFPARSVAVSEHGQDGGNSAARNAQTTGAAMAYFTLITRESEASRWHVQFGDYDRDTVTFEIASTYRDVPAKHRRMVKTPSARQSDINRVLAALNVPALPFFTATA